MRIELRNLSLMITICHHSASFVMPNSDPQGGFFYLTLTLPGFPQALEIMENLENHTKKFHAWKNHGIKITLNNHGKIMEFCEII